MELADEDELLDDDEEGCREQEQNQLHQRRRQARQAGSPEQLLLRELEADRLKVLKQHLESNGLPVSGNKPDHESELRKRLLNGVDGNGASKEDVRISSDAGR